MFYTGWLRLQYLPTLYDFKQYDVNADWNITGTEEMSISGTELQKHNYTIELRLYNKTSRSSNILLLLNHVTVFPLVVLLMFNCAVFWSWTCNLSPTVKIGPVTGRGDSWAWADVVCTLYPAHAGSS